MPHRSRPRRTRHNSVFPVRIKVRSPCRPLAGVLARAAVWLYEQIGRAEYAHHLADTPTGDEAVFYFRRIQHAVAFISMFPELELADPGASRAYPSASGLELRAR